MLASATGDKTLAGSGATLLADLQGREKLATEAPDRLMKAQLHAVQMKKLADEEADTNNPATGNVARSVLAKFLPGANVPADTPARVLLNRLLPIAEKAYGVDESRAGRTEQAQIRAQGMADARDTKAAAVDDKRWTLFGQELDPTKARGGEMAKVVNSLTQYGKIRQLLEQTPNPNAQQLYEIARTFDRAVSGGTPTQSGTEHLIPKTALGSASDFMQWLTNSPVGRNQQVFVKQIADSVNREEQYGQGLLRDWQGKKASRFSDLAKKDSGRYFAELSNWGLAPENFDPNTLAYKGAPKAQPAATAPSGPKQIQSDAEYEALPSGAEFISPDGKHRRKP